MCEPSRSNSRTSGLIEVTSFSNAWYRNIKNTFRVNRRMDKTALYERFLLSIYNLLQTRHLRHRLSVES